MHNANENGCISLDFIGVFRRFRGAKFKLLNIKIPDQNDLVKLWNANPDLYQSGDRNLGAYDPSQNLIAIFSGANQSTVIHETAHVWLTMLERVAQNGNGKAELDLYTIQ